MKVPSLLNPGYLVSCLIPMKRYILFVTFRFVICKSVMFIEGINTFGQSTGVFETRSIWSLRSGWGGQKGTVSEKGFPFWGNYYYLFFLFLNENSLPAIPEHFQELKTTTVELLFQVKDTDTVTLEDAIELLQYPKILVCVYFSCSCWCYLFELGPMMFYFPAGTASWWWSSGTYNTF